jgi:hypothetical protein
MTLGVAKDVAAVAGGVVALLTLLKSLAEYQKQGAQKRADQFLVLRDRFAQFRDLFVLLETDDEELRGQVYDRKLAFLGFYEEISLLLNSNLMRREVAHYMFGYYAIRCWDSSNFWSDLNRDSPYWAAFADFAKRMKATEKQFVFKRSAFRV